MRRRRSTLVIFFPLFSLLFFLLFLLYLFVPFRFKHSSQSDSLPSSIREALSLQPIPEDPGVSAILEAADISSSNKEFRHDAFKERPILTAYLEVANGTSNTILKPLPTRSTTEDQLITQMFPKVQRCSGLFETLPVDAYPETDPFLPWIHDVFPSTDGKYIHLVAQNRRRCGTGLGLEERMNFWEPQMSLFQPVPVVKEVSGKLRLASSFQEATTNETRFLCNFHSLYDDNIYQTMSEFSFNYEYVSWRKGKDSMFQREGKDNTQFWLSQLLFKCPIPERLQSLVQSGKHVENDLAQLFLDVTPIRTPARYKTHLFTAEHIGSKLLAVSQLFDPKSEFGHKHYLPEVKDSGRWANIPICQPPRPKKKHRLVLCTWTASAYTRRGDVVGVSDTEARVREWVLFHQMVGFDHVYLYDNTAPGLPSSLQAIADEFPDFVDYYRWPCAICNNNRPSHKNPGERSSQYAAEASCRERHGSTTDWMAFIDTDEYLVPMAHDTWEPILEEFDQKGLHILKMRSSRAKPRAEYMDTMKNQTLCVDPVPNVRKPPGTPQDCLEPSKNNSFLKTYNCEYIRPPRPDRFERAMKQIYRPDFVQSHFVHYSTVTKDISKYYKDQGPGEAYTQKVHQKKWQDGSPEIFLDEINEGLLVHTRSVLPHESQYREQGCQIGSKWGCALGYVCSDSTPFVDEKHQDNTFIDGEGNYCNCWKNSKVEDIYAPKLERVLEIHMNAKSMK